MATTDEEKLAAKSVIYTNILASMMLMVEQAGKLGTESLIVDVDALEHFKIRVCDKNNHFLPPPWQLIDRLWKDPGIQDTWEMRADYQIVDSVKEYFEDLERISDANYMPTDKDILLSRVRTTGIVTERYQIGKTKYEMYDVGGQRSERRKWIHCFDDVTAVIFVAALNEYNQKLFEDVNTNRMVEALALFEDIAKNRCFHKASFILFLNKKDLFAEKIKASPISDTPEFVDYKGGSDYAAGTQYFVNKFQERFKRGQSRSNPRQLYHHFTCATDTSDVKQVFGICQQVICENNLKALGFL
jgi:hypothetical protein